MYHMIKRPTNLTKKNMFEMAGFNLESSQPHLHEYSTGFSVERNGAKGRQTLNIKITFCIEGEAVYAKATEAYERSCDSLWQVEEQDLETIVRALERRFGVHDREKIGV